ncbi:MAG: Prolyl-tRNA synthetase [Microgenomates group bacterium GW2011_GWA1_48_10]|uniref:Proline--tRNA ligase n=1 Tax=Candidatus Gottesmanbacteria bacterium RIFCSPHIGHO2_01_FULL_47_48 TaxID=1798381 RepID=A0A1F6A366_9BACT|nr:MAG: Prolyl-tRNA synthetase [Microgenomates group bacterium GW2011_GWA1_48_10]OGG18964.1 MAG: hypothetical protein A2721_02385 [Candidatus Gottesmanbacteria bacterium RIFCSPHIGHO2_01_FULL_47_48]
MRYSQLFPKTKKNDPKGAVAPNHKLLVRGGFIDQLMAGSWTLLPLGYRVLTNLCDIIREEMNATGAQEMSFPLLHPKEIWNETGRWDSAREVMYQLKDVREREFALSFTHEEIVMDLIRKHTDSYADLPLKLYQFSTKFRSELRATGGILRGREFYMKDLYSAHESEEDMMKYYWEVKDAYLKIFGRLGLKAVVTEASGGVFTENHTHEFQVFSETGEDIIYYCADCDWAYNKEIFSGRDGDSCPKCGGKLVEKKAIEAGNIFPLGTKYAEKMGAYFTDRSGQRKPFWFASYGIGPSRVMGIIVEAHHDDKGIIWPESVAPFKSHLIEVRGEGLEVRKRAEEVYRRLVEAGQEVLYDDREDVSAGKKFADADLIGIPWRLVVSERTGDKIEMKKRSESEGKLMTVEEVLGTKDEATKIVRLS